MRALLCGSRDWVDRSMVLTVLAGLAHRCPDLVVIEGGARGADRIAADVASRLGVTVEDHPAAWDVHDRGGVTPVPCRCPDDAKTCRAAGVRRNQLMLDEGQPRVVFAFHDDAANAKGTGDMIRRAKAAGIPVYVIAHA